MDHIAPTHAHEIVRNSAMNLGFAMAFSPLALGSVEQEAAHDGVPMATEQETTIFRDNPFSRTTDSWCQFFFRGLLGGFLVSVLFSGDSWCQDSWCQFFFRRKKN
jgi:hypothetical protein